MNTKPIITAGLALAGLAIFAGCTAPQPTAAAPAEPEQITTTEQVEVEVTPGTCIDALDAAEELNRLMGEALDSAARVINAQTYLDAAAIDEETAYLQDLRPKIAAAQDDYSTAALDCRGSEGS